MNLALPVIKGEDIDLRQENTRIIASHRGQDVASLPAFIPLKEMPEFLTVIVRTSIAKKLSDDLRRTAEKYNLLNEDGSINMDRVIEGAIREFEEHPEEATAALKKMLGEPDIDDILECLDDESKVA